MKLAHWLMFFAILLFCPLSVQAEEKRLYGSIRDLETGHFLPNVELWTADSQGVSKPSGQFDLTTSAEKLIVRAHGYLPLELPAETATTRRIKLQPVIPKALYMSFWAAASKNKRREFQQLIDQTEINSLVIDIKSSRGHIAYRSNIPLAREIGAQKIRPLKDLPEYLASLKAQGIYTIGRIVVFKDDLLAKKRPELAVRTLEGEVWQDRDKLSWADPFNQQVHDYNLAVAEEAAALGFDEIQFDYIRFPSQRKLTFARPANDNSRVGAINHFLEQAKQRLAPYPTFISANIFGFICWKHKNGEIGQRLVDLGDRVDYLSPMLYPSGFPHGIPGYSNPVENPYHVIARSLQVAQERGVLDPVRFRPWLQAFRDYAYDRRSFEGDEVHAQINASDANGSHGWMLWNASSRFSLAGLTHQVAKSDLKLVDVSPKAIEPAIITRAEVVSVQENSAYPENNSSLPL